MKTYFLAAYRKKLALQPEAKFLMKLGLYHVAWGHSVMGIQGIGNFVSELAVMGNSQSFHLAVFPFSGTSNAWLPFLPDEFKEISLEEDERSVLQSLLEAIPEKSGWHLYDLRPLGMRQNFWAKENHAFKKLIRSYDGLLLMGRGQAA